MATTSRNVLVNGFRGKLGDALVFKTMRGKTFVNTPARKPNKKKETLAQRGTRVTFKQASEWAQVILLDPQQKAYYQQRAKALKLPNAYTAALTDYMRKPTIKTVINNDKSITCHVSKKDFMLEAATVTLYDAINNITETRPIIRSRLGDFRFTVTVNEWANGVEVNVQHAGGNVIILNV